MLLLKSKILTVMLMLLVFIGQAAAAAVIPCETGTEMHAVSLTTAAVTQSASIINDDVDSFDFDVTSEMFDCCDQGCDCPSGHCAATILLPASHHDWEIFGLQKNSQTKFLVRYQVPTSLYRPPISI